MKVARWKVLGVAGALVLGYAVTSQAAQIKVDEDTFADFGYNMKIMYQNFDERGKGGTDDWKKNVFDIKDSRFYISGQVSKMVQFYGEWNASGAYGKETGGYAKDNKVGLAEGGVNFVFMPELQVRAGKVRVPFTRYQMTSSYSLIIPTDAWYDKGGAGATGIFGKDTGVVGEGKYISTNPLELIGKADGGLVVHGDIANGMFRYNVGVFNEDKRKDEAFKGLQWVARVEFTPTMLGFAPESTTSPHGKVSDTYLGKKDVLTIGLGYYKEKLYDKDSLYGTQFDKSLEADGWTADLFFEKKFGCWVPNLQVGYIKLNDSHFYTADGKKFSNATTAANVKKGDTSLWYAQGQLLYDAVVGFGKPALAIRYENVEADGVASGKKDFAFDRWGVALNYYLKGQAAKVSLGFDKVEYDDAAKAFLKSSESKSEYEDSITDYYLYIQTKF
ncbi:hypothetical protein [Thermodesulfobacterium sp.]|uniref:hypothetical protein n=1 Tax=Thermodesulfobacterium sp. TaxID=1965289 RepID=UPI002647646A|nr:hypothetical protein [Thermodesulfobacterium sp.]MDN5379175.1 hypothetical protein [Thermodesulfobacterium sp.]